MVAPVDILFVFGQGILLIIFYYQIKKQGRTAKFLILALILGLIATLLSIIRSEISDSPLRRIILASLLIIYGFEYFAIYIHFNGTIKDEIEFNHVFSLSILFGIHIGFGLYYIIFGIADLPELLWDISYALLGTIIFSYVAYTLYLAFYYSREKTALTQFIAAIIISFGFFLSIFDTPILRNLINNPLNPSIHNLIKALGVLLLLSVYIINPRYIDRLPINTYAIMVFDKGGNTLAYFQIHSKGKFEDVTDRPSSSLITSLTRALIGFINDALGVKENINLIESQEKTILFDIGEDIGIGVIADRGTEILKSSLSRCKKLLEDNFQFDKRRGRVDRQHLRQILEDSFPYIVFMN